MRPSHEDADLHAFLAGDPATQVRWLRARGLPPAVLLAVHNACAQRCFFCAGPGTVEVAAADRTPLARLVAHLDARPVDEHGAPVDRLLLGGNEPTLHPAFEEVLRHASEVGYRELHLMTNGATLRGRVGRWASLGLAEVVVPLYSVGPEPHDTICGVPCHADVLAGLDEAAAVGVRVRVHTLLLRRTLGDLGALAVWVHERFGAPLSVGLLRPKDRFDWAREAPTLGEIRRALADIPVDVRPTPLVAPLCLTRGQGDALIPSASPSPPLPSAPLLATLYFSSQARRYPAACDGCADRAGCPGVVEAYG